MKRFILVLCILIGLIYVKFTYPLKYKDLIDEYSREYDVDPYLIAAIINVESKYDVEAISPKESRGLMQISPITGEWAFRELSIGEYDVEELFKPDVNIRIGSWYLRVLFKEFENDLKLVLAAYNAGSGNVSKWLKDSQYSSDGKVLEHIPFGETREYIKRVEKNLKIYRIIHRLQFD